MVDATGMDKERPETAGDADPGRRFELYEAILLAVAAVLIAWAAFQSTKWSGIQADNYSRASAARTESSLAATQAGQLMVIDVDMFTAWVAAISADERAGVVVPSPAESYVPVPGTEAGFLYQRFRAEMVKAMEAWLAASPLTDADAPGTPFEMPEYRVREAERSLELEAQAETFAAEARRANEIGDGYVLMTILFTIVLVFVGVATKMRTLRARVFLFVSAAAVLLIASVIVFTFPVEL